MKNRFYFSKCFKNWRHQKGMSAYRIAKLTGVNPSFISNIEANRRPMSDDFMRKVAAIPELELTYETLRSWRILDEYRANEIELASNYLSKKNKSSEQPAAAMLSAIGQITL